MEYPIKKNKFICALRNVEYNEFSHQPSNTLKYENALSNIAATEK